MVHRGCALPFYLKYIFVYFEIFVYFVVKPFIVPNFRTFIIDLQLYAPHGLRYT